LLCKKCINDSSVVSGYNGPTINSTYKYELMIMSPTVVHCALMDKENELKNKGPSGPTICKISNSTWYEKAST